MSGDKTVKVTNETWKSISHESTDRGTTARDLLGVAWEYFMTLPESAREQMVRAAAAAREQRQEVA